MFTITCAYCGKKVPFKNGKNNESAISLGGEVEVLYDANVYIECTCGNEITVEK